jgi:hypothetical protein
MTRLDWLLVRPARNGRRRAEPLRRLEQAIAARLAAARTRVLSPAAVDELCDLETRLDDLTLSECEAVNAPVYRDDPDGPERLAAMYQDEGDDRALEAWVHDRLDDFDCDKCPFASRYSLYPSSPCELSAGPLRIVLADHPDLVDRLALPMGPAEMQQLAASLREVLQGGSFHAVEGLDTRDYLTAAVRFLESWAARGFGVDPDLDADEPFPTPEGPLHIPRVAPTSILH